MVIYESFLKTLKFPSTFHESDINRTDTMRTEHIFVTNSKAQILVFMNKIHKISVTFKI